MMALKRVICIILIVCFLGTNILYAQGGSIFHKLAPPSGFSRMSGLEFKQSAQIIVGIKESLKGLDRLDRDHLVALGEKQFHEYTVFGEKITGELFFQDAVEGVFDERVRLRGEHYLIKAHVANGGMFYCLISKGRGAKYNVSAIPERVMDLALGKGLVKFIHGSVHRTDKNILGKYLRHEVKTGKYEAIDPWIRDNMLNERFAVSKETGAQARYKHKGYRYGTSNLEKVFERINQCLECLGVDARDEIIEAVKRVPLVFIPYENPKDLPRIRIGNDFIPVYGHSSKFATYIFIEQTQFDKITTQGEWIEEEIDIAGIEKILLHEIGARCGLDVRVEGDLKSRNILDDYYEVYDKLGEQALRDLEIQPEIVEKLKNLRYLDLQELEERHDYAYYADTTIDDEEVLPSYRERAVDLLESDRNMSVEDVMFRRKVEATARDAFKRAKKNRHWLLRRILSLRGVSEWLIRFATEHQNTQRNIFHFTISLGGIEFKKGDRKHNTQQSRRIIANMSDYLRGKENRVLVRVSTSIIVALSKPAFMSRFFAWVIRLIVENVMARRFFIGQRLDKAIQTYEKLKSKGFSLTVDNVGEMSLCADDTNKYVKGYLKLTRKGVPAISVKLSNLTPHWNSNAWERTKKPVIDQMRRIIDAAAMVGAEVTIDMEEYEYKDLTIRIFLELLEKTRYPKLSIAIQSYLRDTREDLEYIVSRVKAEGLKPPLIRLVKGANKTPDEIAAENKGYDVPQFHYKSETDINFERCAEYMFENRQYLRLAFATHNIQSMAVVIELARKMKVRGDEFMFQYLHGMIPDEVVKSIQELEIGGKKINLLFYGPFGSFVRGLGYFVRRLLEKTDIESVVKNEGYREAVIDDAVRDPRDVLKEELKNPPKKAPVSSQPKRDPILPEVWDGLNAAEKIADHFIRAGNRKGEEIAGIFLRYRHEVMDLAEEASRGLMDMKGRTNELIIEPRGKVVFICEDPHARDEDIAERIAAPLAAGNSMTVFVENEEQRERFVSVFKDAGISENEVEFTNFFETSTITQGTIDSISYQGTPDKAGRTRALELYQKSSTDLSRFIPGSDNYVPGTVDTNFVFDVDPDYVKQFLRTKVVSEVTSRSGFNPQTMEGLARKGLPEFKNVAQVKLFQEENQKALMKEVEEVKRRYKAGDLLPLVIGGKKYKRHSNQTEITSASDPDHKMGWMSLAQPDDVKMAVKVARKAQPGWDDLGAEKRKEILFKFAKLAKKKRLELAALMMWESGKIAEEALADVDEGIDFAMFYALDALRSEEEEARRSKLGGLWEGRHTEANGVSAVISPWNFPFAIPVGQIMSSLAAGNSVIFKPSGQSPLIGYEIIKLLQEAGVHDGAVNFLSGRGKEAGEALVLHPDVDEIVFTGSAEAGVRIKELAAGVDRGNRPPKHIIAEMGGNNAIIVDEGTDIEYAIKNIIFPSAFGYSSQKCSACNRVIVMDGIYQQFLDRLEEAAKALQEVMDNPRKLGTLFGPLIDAGARRSMKTFIKRAHDAGFKVHVEGKSETANIEFKIYKDVDPKSPLAQEEQFFPSLLIMKGGTSFENAVDILNDTAYALTGGLISQIPAHIEYAREHVKVGNFTVNGKITGAMVGQQSFGGSGLSGFSGFASKAGGMGHVWYHRHWGWGKTTEKALEGDEASIRALTKHGRDLKKDETREIDYRNRRYSLRKYSLDLGRERLLVRAHYAKTDKAEWRKDRVYVFDIKKRFPVKIDGQDYFEIFSYEAIEDIQDSLFEFSFRDKSGVPIRAPKDIDIRAIASKILELDIEVFMPTSQFPGDSLKKFKQGLGRVFQDRIRPFNDPRELVRMIKHPEKAVVMTVDLTADQIIGFEQEATRFDADFKNVRFMNFKGQDVDQLIKHGTYENYLKDVLSKLLVARAITEDDTKDPSSPYYMMLAHLLDGYMHKGAIDDYIRRIVDNQINPFVKLRSLLKAVLRKVPIEAYDDDQIKPAVEVLWAA